MALHAGSTSGGSTAALLFYNHGQITNTAILMDDIRCKDAKNITLDDWASLRRNYPDIDNNLHRYRRLVTIPEDAEHMGVEKIVEIRGGYVVATLGPKTAQDKLIEDLKGADVTTEARIMELCRNALRRSNNESDIIPRRYRLVEERAEGRVVIEGRMFTGSFVLVKPNHNITVFTIPFGSVRETPPIEQNLSRADGDFHVFGQGVGFGRTYLQENLPKKLNNRGELNDRGALELLRGAIERVHNLQGTNFMISEYSNGYIIRQANGRIMGNATIPTTRP